MGQKEGGRRTKIIQKPNSMKKHLMIGKKPVHIITQSGEESSARELAKNAKWKGNTTKITVPGFRHNTKQKSSRKANLRYRCENVLGGERVERILLTGGLGWHGCSHVGGGCTLCEGGVVKGKKRASVRP